MAALSAIVNRRKNAAQRGANLGQYGGGGFATGTRETNRQENTYRNYTQPALAYGGNLLSGGYGFNPYPGQRVAGLNSDINTALRNIRNLAGTVQGQSGDTLNQVSSVAQNGGMTPRISNAIKNMQSLGNQQIGGTQKYLNISNDPLNNMQDRAGRIMTRTTNSAYNDPVKRYLTDTASGKYLEQGNPYYREKAQNEADAVADMMNRQFSGSGRYGSAANQGTVGKTTGDMMLNALNEDWNRERNLQVQAAQMLQNANDTSFNQSLSGAQSLANLGQTGQQNRMAAIQGAAGIQQQNLANRLSAGSNALNALQTAQNTGLQAAALTPSLTNNMFAGTNALTQSGNFLRGVNQDQINADMNVWNEMEQAPWNRLGAYMGGLQYAGPQNSGGSSDSSGGFLSSLGAIGSAVAPVSGLVSGISSLF